MEHAQIPGDRSFGPAAGFGLLCGMVVLAVVALKANFALLPGRLMQPLDPGLVLGAVLMGVSAAALLAVVCLRRLLAGETPLTMQAVGALVGAMGLVGYVLPVGLVRDSVQVASFAGLVPPTRVTRFVVTGSHYDWWAKWGGYVVEVQAPGRAYTIMLPASKEAYDAARPGDRIDLPVQTGRREVQRVIAPVRLALADLRHA